MPLINYKPSAPRGGRKVKEQEHSAFMNRYAERGMSDEVIQAMENVIQSSRIDYKVRTVYLHLTYSLNPA
jgi:hypothetical protein